MLFRSRLRQETVDLFEAWERGDEARLEELLFRPLTEEPEFASLYERLFFERNRKMSEKLGELASDGRTRFVVLGAGHMLGDRGIPALLAGRGFEVEPLPPGVAP